MSHAAQRVADEARVGEVADRQLHPHPLGPEAARVADQAAHRLPRARQPAQRRREPEQSGGARQQEHAAGYPQPTASIARPWPT